MWTLIVNLIILFCGITVLSSTWAYYFEEDAFSKKMNLDRAVVATIILLVAIFVEYR